VKFQVGQLVKDWSELGSQLGIAARLAWRAFVKGEVLGFRVGTLARHTGYCWTTLDPADCWQKPDGSLMLPGGSILHEDGTIELSFRGEDAASDNDLVLVIGKEPIHWRDTARGPIYLQQVTRCRDGARFYADMMDISLRTLSK